MWYHTLVWMSICAKIYVLWWHAQNNIGKSNVLNILNGKHFCSLALMMFYTKCAHINAFWKSDFQHELNSLWINKMQKSFEWKWVCWKWAEIHFAEGYIMVFICISNILVYAYQMRVSHECWTVEHVKYGNWNLTLCFRTYKILGQNFKVI